MPNLGETAQEAADILTGQRLTEYGDPIDNATHAAKVFNAITGKCLQPEDMVLAMMAWKFAREMNGTKADNIVDLCGYADIWAYMRNGDNEVPHFDVPIRVPVNPVDDRELCGSCKGDD